MLSPRRTSVAAPVMLRSPRVISARSGAPLTAPCRARRARACWWRIGGAWRSGRSCCPLCTSSSSASRRTSPRKASTRCARAGIIANLGAGPRSTRRGIDARRHGLLRKARSAARGVGAAAGLAAVGQTGTTSRRPRPRCRSRATCAARAAQKIWRPRCALPASAGCRARRYPRCVAFQIEHARAARAPPRVTDAAAPASQAPAVPAGLRRDRHPARGADLRREA